MKDDKRPTRLAELLASLSIATDLGMGQPMEQAMRTCLLAVEVGRALEIPLDALSDTYYLALLRFIGCTADAHEAAAAVGGDEIGFRAGVATVLMGDTSELLRHLIQHYAEGRPALDRVRLLIKAIADGKNAPKRSIAEHCEVAQLLLAQIGISERVGIYIGSLFERWDGKGLPGELSGEAIPVAARVVAVARDVDLFHQAGGRTLVVEMLKRRRGTAYDPKVVDAFLEFETDEHWFDALTQEPLVDSVLEAEPGQLLLVDEDSLDDVLQAFAAFTDLKCPSSFGHSFHVAELSRKAARSLGFAEDDEKLVYRAALVHDLGKIGISNGILEKPGPLTPSEWERIRLHPYLTERILNFATPLRSLAVVAGSHHERLDGTGYHRNSVAAFLPPAARLLAAANMYQSLCEDRPHRSAMNRASREALLSAEVTAGRLDANAVEAVLVAAGYGTPRVPRSSPAGLSDREIEVLRLISLGHSNRVVANELTLSVKTVGRHVENIYTKIGVSSRAAAAVYAMQNQLL